MKPFAVILAAIALASSAVHASNNISIQWGKPFDLGRGYYARIHRLNDGRLMAGYALDGMVARFYTRGKDRMLWNSLCPLDDDYRWRAKIS